MFQVSYLPDGRRALTADAPDLTGWETYQDKLTFLGEELGGNAGRAHERRDCEPRLARQWS